MPVYADSVLFLMDVLDLVFEGCYLLSSTHCRCWGCVWPHAGDSHWVLFLLYSPASLRDSQFLDVLVPKGVVVLLAEFAQSFEFGVEIVELLTVERGRLLYSPQIREFWKILVLDIDWGCWLRKASTSFIVLKEQIWSLRNNQSGLWIRFHELYLRYSLMEVFE